MFENLQFWRGTEQNGARYGAGRENPIMQAGAGGETLGRFFNLAGNGVELFRKDRAARGGVCVNSLFESPGCLALAIWASKA